MGNNIITRMKAMRPFEMQTKNSKSKISQMGIDEYNNMLLKSKANSTNTDNTLIKN